MRKIGIALLGRGCFRRRVALLSIAGACLLGIGVPAAASAATRTWNGGGATGSPNWTNASNWSGGNGPANLDSVFFPNLAGCNTAANTCYTSNNDNASLTLAQFTLSAAGAYSISGSPITLNAGGLNLGSDVTSTATGHNNVGLHFTLGADQTWSVDGNGNGSQLTLSGGVSGAHAVGVTLAHEGTLIVQTSPMDVGSLTVSGLSTSNSGPTAASNGSLILSGTGLNPTGSAVSLSDIDVVSSGGSIGGTLSTTGDNFQIGSPGGSGQTLTLSGSTPATFDSGSTFQMWMRNPSGAPVAGTDNSEVTGSAPVNLNNVNLALMRSDFAACGTAVPVGTVFTLAHFPSPGSLTGTFNGLPDGSTVQVGPCTNKTTLRINYTAHDATATVVASGAINTMTSLTAPNSATAGQSVSYTGTVTAQSGSTAPTGKVEFTDNGTPIASCGGAGGVSLSGPSGPAAAAVCNAGAIGAGSHTIVATYQPADSSFNSSSDMKMFTATAASTTGGGTTTTTTTTTTPTVVVPSGASLAQIFAAVQAAAAAIDAQLTSFTPATLANKSALFFNISFLTGGTATIVIYVTPQGTAARAAASKRIKLTSGSATLKSSGRAKIKLRLSKKGRDALKHAKKARLSIVVTFTPSNNPKGKQTFSSSVTLRSKKTTKKK